MNANFCIKINRRNILSSLAVFLLSCYAFSQLGFSNLLPENFNKGLLIIAVLLILVDDLYYRYKLKNIVFLLLSIVMILITLFWKNQEIARYGWPIQLYNVCLYIFYWTTRDQKRWHKTFLRMMMLCGIFYTFGSYLCTFNQSFYNNIIYPLMQPMGYIRDYKAGFTASYGTNGLYMCLGLCTILPFLFLNPLHKVQKTDYVCTIVLLAGMLLSGKRGQFLAVVAAFFVGYYFFYTNRKHGRIMKIIGIGAVAIICLYLISLFMPAILTIVERFQEQIEKGDISTGRFLMWGRAWELFLQAPFSGHGWRWFRYSSFTLVDYDVHNVFLQLLVEVGILGALPFYIFIFGNIILAIKMLVEIRKKDPHYENTVYLVIAVVYEIFFIALCATGTALYQFEYMFPFFACCGLVNYYSKEVKERMK